MNIFKGSWRTTLLGILCLVIGLRSFWLHWDSNQGVWFNLTVIETGSIGLLLIGWALIHARDHRH